MAQGIYHIFNTAKMIIMEAMYKSYPNSVSSKEIVKVTGMEKGKVSRLLSHYHYHNYHYFRRLKKKDIDGSYRYKINKKGIKTYFAFVLRVHQGYDLNLKKKTPMKMETYKGLKKAKIKSEKDLVLTPDELSPYIRVSRRGEYELGVKKEDALKIAGIIKDEPVKEPEEPIEPVITEMPEIPIAEPEEQFLPSKTYNLKDGSELSSQEMAEVLKFGINKINGELKSTANTRKIKKLQDKKRTFLMWIINNPDIKQYIQN